MFQNVDIVIPVYALKPFQVDRLVDSILKQDVGSVEKINLFLVINPARSEQFTEWQNQILSNFQKNPWSFKIIYSEMAGVNRARQLGVNEGLSEIVFFFDDDVILEDKDILKNHLEFHKNNPETFACGGYYTTDTRHGVFSKLYLLRQKHWLNESFLDQQKKLVGYLIGGHFSIKRSLLQKAGISFDVNIKFGSSETDFFQSACAKNLKLSLQKWTVTHDLQDGPLRLLQKTYLQGRGKSYIEKKGLNFQPIYRSMIVTNLFSEKIVALLYDLVFSWGYYAFNHQYGLFFKSYLKKILLQLNYSRQKLVNYLRRDL